MSTYLVTGAAGFIGRSIAAALLSRGETVVGVDNFLTGKRVNLESLNSMEFIEGDLKEPSLCARICAGVDVIFHEAALASVPSSIADPVSTNGNCVDATLNLLIAAQHAGVRRVIFAGSSSVYGDDPTLPKHETMLPMPMSPYAVAKLAGEYYMSTFNRVHGLETVVLRYFNVFGPYQDAASDYSGALATFCRRMLADEQPIIYGDGEQSRDFTFIDNVVHANLLAAMLPAVQVSGRTMNVATGKRHSLNETVALLSALTGYGGRPSYRPARLGDIRHSEADIGQIRKLMGYAPHVDFLEGLRRTVEWYKDGRIGCQGIASSAVAEHPMQETNSVLCC